MFTLTSHLKFNVFLAACLVSTRVLLATPADPAKPTSFNSSVYIAKDNKIRVAVEKTALDRVIISLRPLETGQPCIFNRTMGKKQHKLALKLDVSELADGVYELEIKSPTDHLTKQLTLSTPVKQTQASRTIALLPPPATDALFSVK